MRGAVLLMPVRWATLPTIENVSSQDFTDVFILSPKYDVCGQVIWGRSREHPKWPASHLLNSAISKAPEPNRAYQAALREIVRLCFLGKFGAGFSNRKLASIVNGMAAKQTLFRHSEMDFVETPHA